MATVTTRIKDVRVAFQAAQGFAEKAQVSLTSLTFDFTANDCVIVYNDASTDSPDTLRSHNKGILDAAYATLADEQPGGAEARADNNGALRLPVAPARTEEGTVWRTVSGVFSTIGGVTVRLDN